MVKRINHSTGNPEEKAIKIILLAKEKVDAVRYEILDVYREAFAPPPYHRTETDVQHFDYALTRHLDCLDFRCFIAQKIQTGEIVGFVYGFTSLPGQWWHDLVANALPFQTAHLWLSDAFELVELAVKPSAQGRGFGKRLHDAILTGLPHHTAVLSTMHAETIAMHLYRRSGWVTLLEYFTFPGTSRPYRIMGRKLYGK